MVKMDKTDKMDKRVKVPLNLFTEQRIPIPNPEYLYLRQEYSKLISQVPRDNSDDTEFIGGMPVQMERNCLKQLLKQPSYHMTLKVDGERFLLFLASNGTIYLIDRSLTFYYFLDDTLKNRLLSLSMKPFLFDGELVLRGKDYEYLIFDTLFYDNTSFINQPYTIRYDVINFAIKNVFDDYLKQATKFITITAKQWFSINIIKSTNNIYKYVADQTNKSRKVSLKADGIILQPFDTPYVPFGPWNKYYNIQFKWKPSDELTIDFKIKAVSKNEWNLYTKSDQLYNINQPNGDPLPATCIPTESQQKSFFDGDIVEFIFKKTGNPNKNLFVPLRTRNEKEANSLSTIMSTMCVIHNPFDLDLVRDGLKYMETRNPPDLKKYLSLFSESDLVMCSVKEFFTKREQKDIKKVYTLFQQQPEETCELEFRIFKIGKKDKTIDKFTFYYIRDFFLKYFKLVETNTIDIIENKNKLIKYRSTYNNVLKEIMERNSLVNEYKERVTNYRFEPELKKKMYNNLGFKLELSNEVEIPNVVGLRSHYAGKMVNNQIRVKNRFSFDINGLWRVDLTKVVNGYTLESLKDKNETFEFECEFMGDQQTTFEVFIKSMDNLFRLIIENSNYCDTCV